MTSLLILCEPCYSSFSYLRSSKRAITDEISPGIAFFLVFRKHVRYVARLRAWTVAKESQPRQLVWKFQKRNVLIFAFWKTSKQKWLTLCLICLFYSLFIQCGGGWGRTPISIYLIFFGKLEFKNLVKDNNMDIAQARLRLYSVTH